MSLRKSNALTGFWWTSEGCCLFFLRGIGAQREKFSSKMR